MTNTIRKKWPVLYYHGMPDLIKELHPAFESIHSH